MIPPTHVYCIVTFYGNNRSIQYITFYGSYILEQALEEPSGSLYLGRTAKDRIVSN